MTSPDVAERSQYLSFTLGGAAYGVGILQVKEILQVETVTRVPGMPPSVRGVINLRGSVVPVIDLARKLGQPPAEDSRRTCILVVEASLDGLATVMGVVADSVSEVLELGPGDVEPPPPFGTRVRADFLRGLGKVGRDFVLLLDLDRILSADDLAAAAAAAEGPQALPEGLLAPPPAPEARAPGAGAP